MSSFPVVRSVLGCLLCSSLLVTPALASDLASRTVTYYDNVSVTVPEHVQRVATSWEAQNSILTMLGYGDRIVATTRFARDTPAFRKFVPSIAKVALATSASAADVDVERLLTLKPDILFVTEGFPEAKQQQLQRAGIAVAAFRANSMDALVERVELTGKLLGDEAYAKAQRYRAYFDHNRQRVSERLAKIPAEQRLKVYLASGTPLTTSGRPSLNQDWMDLGGAVNVAEQWQLRDSSHNSANVNLEAIMAANPDVIISMRAEDVATIKADPRWRNIRAVQQGKVYANPRGMFWWCRETSEEALQFLWVATLLYPAQFTDIDMRNETRDFYHEFYGVQLSETDIDSFLHPAIQPQSDAAKREARR